MAITTNKEYLLKSLAKFNISEDDVDVILAESPTVIGTASVNVKACKEAVYRSLSSILPLANVSEGHYSVSWNMEALKLWYNALCKELGKPSVSRPAIRNRSDIW